MEWHGVNAIRKSGNEWIIVKCVVYIEEYIGGNSGYLASPKVFLTPQGIGRTNTFNILDLRILSTQNGC